MCMMRLLSRLSALCVIAVMAGLPLSVQAGSQVSMQTLEKLLWQFVDESYTTPGISVNPDDNFHALHHACLADGTFDAYLKGRWNLEIPTSNDFPAMCLPSSQVIPTSEYYMNDIANGFLYTNDDSPPCGCSLETWAKAYPNYDGTYVLIKHWYRQCWYAQGSQASHPLETILPKNFGPELFLLPGKTVHTTELSQFVVWLLPERLTLRLVAVIRPLKLGMFLPPHQGLRFIAEPLDEVGAPPMRDMLYLGAIAHYGSAALLKAMDQGRFDTLPEDDFKAALRTAYANGSCYGDYSLKQFREDCTDAYRIYSTYIKLDLRPVLMEKTSPGRFTIVGRGAAPEKNFSAFHLFLQQSDYWRAVCGRDPVKLAQCMNPMP